MSRDKRSDTGSTAPLLRVACPMLAITALGWLAPAHAQGSPQLSESEFLNDVPIVLSVSRMPQRLDETPGSVMFPPPDLDPDAPPPA